MSENQVLHLNIDFSALQSLYLTKIQALTDVMRVLFGSMQTSSETDLQSYSQFKTFSLSNRKPLSQSDAKQAAEQWLLRAFVHEVVDISNVYLDDANHLCKVMTLVAKSEIKLRDAANIFGEKDNQFHWKGMEEKLAFLKEKYNVTTTLHSHFVSMNQARKCLAHRLGIISDKDVDKTTGKLAIKTRTFELVEVDNHDKSERVIDRPGIVIGESKTVVLRVKDNERVFSIGDSIQLTHEELFSCATTCFGLSVDIGQAVEQYGKSLGLSYEAGTKKTLVV